VKNKLSTYEKKRDFRKTPEPIPRIKKSKPRHLFVVQQHHASHMHYDLRLEIDGVLKSWAIPKGPSLSPREKRLAALTEDHPVDYARFEGIIPQGYGAGTVIVWDTGTYDNVTEQEGQPISISEAFKKGHIKIEFKGKKLQGIFALIKLKSDPNWLLIKVNDRYAQHNKKDPITNKTQSVLSKKSIAKLDKIFNALHRKKS
jgi:DNA ligase D-like protein (predicted 3'-phosphoesterase)